MFTTTETKVVTGRFLSTENLQKRSEAELDFIFSIYKTIGNDLDEFLAEHHINFKRIGNPIGIPDDFKAFLDNKQKNFSFPDSEKYAVFALNYGGRDEIVRGINRILEEKKQITTISEEELSKHMDLGTLPPVEMVIRTKGDEAQRTSGFMSRWIGYAELYFSPKTYPDFTSTDLDESLKRFDSIANKRNY